MDEYLRYGDEVSLSSEEVYFLSSKGFIDTSVNAVESSSADFFFSVFRVFPQTIHSIQTELLFTANSELKHSLKDLVYRLIQ